MSFVHIGSTWTGRTFLLPRSSLHAGSYLHVIGVYCIIAADQPQLLSVMKMLGRRVPYRRFSAADDWDYQAGGCAQNIHFGVVHRPGDRRIMSLASRTSAASG